MVREGTSPQRYLERQETDKWSVGLSALIYFGFVISTVVHEFMTVKAAGPMDGDNLLSWLLLVPAMILAASLWLPLRSRILFLLIAHVMLFAVLSVDRAYYAFVQDTPLLSSLPYLWDAMDWRGALGFVFSVHTLLAALYWTFLLLCYSQYKHLGFNPLKTQFATTGVGSMVLGLAGFGAVLLLLHGWLDWRSQRLMAEDVADVQTNDVFLTAFSREVRIRKRGLMQYHMHEAYQMLKTGLALNTLSHDRVEFVEQVLDEKWRLNRQTSPYFGLAKDRKLMMIQLNHWGAFLTGLRHGETPVTPMFNDLVGRGLYWRGVVDVTKHGRQADAEFAAMTGLLPVSDKAAQMGYIDQVVLTLPKLLKQRGYSTSVFHGDDGEAWNRDFAYRHYGFDRIYFGYTMPSSRGSVDIKAYDFLLTKLTQRGGQGPWFDFFVSTGRHPVSKPAYEALFSVDSHQGLQESQGRQAWLAYLKRVRQADDDLAAFFKRLPDEIRYSSVFVIYGSHAPDQIGGRPVADWLPGERSRLWSDRVPVLVYMPGKDIQLQAFAPRVRDATAGLHDVMPTVLHLLGIEVPNGVMGVHLLQDPAGRPAVPLPQAPVLVAHQGLVYRNDKIVARLLPGSNAVTAPPSFRKVFMDQLVSRDVLRHGLLAEPKLAGIYGRP